MPRPPDPDTLVATWLEDGPTDLPDETRRAITVALRTRPRARRMAVQGGIMLRGNHLILAAGLMLAVGLGVFALSDRAEPTAPPSPSPPAALAPASTTSASSPPVPIDTSSWTPYRSATYGSGQNAFTISHPAGWTVTPATRAWRFGTDTRAALPESAGADQFTSPDKSIRVSFWTVPVDGTSIESRADVETWAQAYCQETGNTPCTGIHERMVPMCIEHRDCHPAVIVPFRDDVEAFGAGGILPDGMVVVAVWRPETDPSVAAYGGSQRLLEGFLSTMGVFPPSGPDSQP